MQHPVKKKARSAFKRRFVLLAALLCLALAVAFVLMIPQIKRRHQPAATQIFTPAPVQRVFAITPAEEIDSVTVTPPVGESYTLRMKGGTLWLEEAGELRDINDAYEKELLSSVTQIVGQDVAAEDVREVQDHLADMGLLQPKASAVIRYTDGTETMLAIGAAVPNTTYAYCRWSGSPAVYMCDSGVVDALTLAKNQLPPVQQPVIDVELLNGLTLENAHDRMRLSFTDGIYGCMEEPVPYPLDGAAAAQLVTAVGNFRLGTLEGSIEDPSVYGFDDPLCTLELDLSSGFVSEVDANGELVTLWRQAQALRFVIGRAEGAFFYTCEYEGSCYLVSRFLVETLISTKKEDLLARSPLDLADQPIRRIEIQTGSASVQINAVRTERVLPNNELEVDANGNAVLDTTVTLNGKTAAPELLDELASRLRSMKASSDAPANWTADASPRWSILVETESGLVRTVEATRLDLFTDVISVDGVALHCVDSETIERITDGLL